VAELPPNNGSRPETITVSLWSRDHHLVAVVIDDVNVC